MNIYLNGVLTEVECANLATLLTQLDYRQDRVATAVNGAFVSRQQRDSIALIEGMCVEIVAPMQGG